MGCFKPKTSSASKEAEAQAKADSIEATRQRAAAEEDNAALKAEAKQRRTEDRIMQLSGRVGRKSLFTGGQGGVGFPGRGRVFTGTGVAANSSPVSGGAGSAPAPAPQGGGMSATNAARVSIGRMFGGVKVKIK